MIKKSPLAPRVFPELPAIAGVSLAVGETMIKYHNRSDLVLVKLEAGTTAAGVYTRSCTAAAPVEWCRKAIKNGLAEALVINSGNANAFTGKAGELSVERTVEVVAGILSCNPSNIFVASTGVIGEPLKEEKLIKILPDVYKTLDASNWKEAAQAIMTTDTFAKGASRTAYIGDREVTINGIAKGSGMIAPDMATLLSFVFTDAKIDSVVLQSLLAGGVEKSFNSITVDSDTSTNDTLMMFATGLAENNEAESLDDFREKLDDLLIDLARQVVRDGEGATKFISINVIGAQNDGSAKRIGLAIGNSPLVKTAIAGEDANWGRIVMAVGKAREKIDKNKLTIKIGGNTITSMGQIMAGYEETRVNEHMKGLNIDISVDVGVGKGKSTIWTCDLTQGYISINADYRS